MSFATVLTLLLVHLADLTLSACEGTTHHLDITDDTAGDTSDAPDLDSAPADTTAALTWDHDIAPIFGTRCTPCHAAWASSYAGVLPYIASGRLRSQVASGHRISGTDQARVLAWLDGGHPER
jgi:hypothetical protein